MENTFTVIKKKIKMIPRKNSLHPCPLVHSGNQADLTLRKDKQRFFFFFFLSVFHSQACCEREVLEVRTHFKSNKMSAKGGKLISWQDHKLLTLPYAGNIRRMVIGSSFYKSLASRAKKMLQSRKRALAGVLECTFQAHASIYLKF